MRPASIETPVSATQPITSRCGSRPRLRRIVSWAPSRSQRHRTCRVNPWSSEAAPDVNETFGLGAHLAAEIFHGGLQAAASMRDAQGAERHLDRAEHAEHHRCVDVAHVGDPERAALQIANPATEDDAALLATIVAEHVR